MGRSIGVERRTKLFPWREAAARRLVRVRSRLVLGSLDVLMVVVGYVGMLLARYDLHVPAEAWSGLWVFLPLAVVIHLVANQFAGLYGAVWEQASIREAQSVLLAGLSAVVLAGTTAFLVPPLVPRSVAIVGSGIATGLFGLLRFQSRLFAFHRRAVPDGDRVLIVGAGESAGALLRELGRGGTTAMRPVGLLDDDPRLIGRSLCGIRVVGTIDDLVTVGRAVQPDQVLLAIPSATSPLVRRVADAAAELGAQLKVLPRVDELFDGRPRLRDVRETSIDDLLGRQEVSTELMPVRDLIRGRRVMVTGGGGSIGSEIARQVASYGPSSLVLLDRDETHLFDAAAAVPLECEQLLLDVRDRRRVRESFLRERPEIVFHTAAHKHVPLLEAFPAEAAATNVLGTSNVVTAARDAGVEHFVFVSTDKAVKPRSVMGASKRIGEQLVLTAAPLDAHWCAVRFGNVLGSRGSVVPTFMRQISEGGPVTVTHPDVTRFFMSIPEAVQLVLQAAALAKGHGVFMLDMGEPVRIMDLAKRMISLAGYRAGIDVDIQITGLRPGEKLTEELAATDERATPTYHPQVRRLHPPLLEDRSIRELLRLLRAAVDRHDDDRIWELLFAGAYCDASVIRVPYLAADPPVVIAVPDAAIEPSITGPRRTGRHT